MSSKLKANALFLVYFSNILKNGTNKCWLPAKKDSYLSSIQKYWISKSNFLYLKIYDKKNPKIQIGYITRQKIEYTP